MRHFYNLTFLLFVFGFQQKSAFAMPPTTNYYTLISGNFFNASLWGKNSTTVACGCYPDDDGACDIVIPANAVLYIRHAVTSNCNISIGSNSTIIIQGGGNLTLTGNASVTGTGNFQVDAGGTVNVGGNLALSGSGSVTVNGTMNVNGNLSFGGSSSLCGTGNLNIGGSISGGAPCVSITLPIDLIYFNAENANEHVRIYWATASEQQNMFFTIYRSTDGINYTAIGTLQGAGNSDYLINYEFFDEDPVNGVSYYKLSQTDIDGTTKTFYPVSVNRNDFGVLPNLIGSNEPITIFISHHKGEELLINIVNLQGKIVYSNTIIPSQLHDRIQIQNASGLSPGVYFVSIHWKGQNQGLKFLVK